LKIKFFYLIFIIFFFPLSQLSIAEFQEENLNNVNLLFINKPILHLEIADTYKKRKLGLMHRKKLDKYSGMLFDYQGLHYVEIWMKNMHIPLDILFIKNNKIIFIIENAKPCNLNNKNCPTYGTNKPVDSIIELNSGIVKEYGLKIGDKLNYF